MAKEQNLAVIKNILTNIKEILKQEESFSTVLSNKNNMKVFLSNRANAFQQLCFYSKYKNISPNESSVMHTSYLNWKAIFDSYNNPDKVLFNLNSGKLTKKQQLAIITHFLGDTYSKTKNKHPFLEQTKKLMELKFSNSK